MGECYKCGKQCRAKFGGLLKPCVPDAANAVAEVIEDEICQSNSMIWTKIIARHARTYGNVRFTEGALSVATPMVTEGEIEKALNQAWMCNRRFSVSTAKDNLTTLLTGAGIRVVTDARADALADDVEKGGGGDG